MNYIYLTNAEGKTICVRFRAFEPEDADAVINCIRDEYGDKYHKRNMYDRNYILNQNETGRLKFYLAELDSGKVIGMIGLQRNLPSDTSCSIVSIITLREYRNYHMFWHFARYIYSRIRKLPNVSAIYCRMVTYHDITQKLMERLGLKACGFVPSLVIADQFQHSFQRDDNIKNTLAIMIRKMNKHDVGTIYLPAEHVEIAQKIYNSLRLKYDINTEPISLSGTSEVLVTNDDIHKSCTIEILSSGEDLMTKINDIHSKFTSQYQTFNIFLNISDKRAVVAYKELVKLGYFFTGFKPICGQNEFMILHNARNVDIHFDSLKLTKSFAELKDYVKNFYESRYEVET
ncbi:MAG: hypothetical protein IJ797_00280 [Selenomonadaceae bacterium]|nr:hypothetical protein [Selenomonadaceae bacterium]